MVSFALERRVASNERGKTPLCLTFKVLAFRQQQHSALSTDCSLDIPLPTCS